MVSVAAFYHLLGKGVSRAFLKYCNSSTASSVIVSTHFRVQRIRMPAVVTGIRCRYLILRLCEKVEP